MVDGVVPLAMKLMASEIDGFEFGIGDLDAGGIDIFVELAANFQAGLLSSWRRSVAR